SAVISRPSSRIRACSSSAVIRISPTPRSSSALVTDGGHPFALDDPRHGDDLVAAHDERPAFAVGARDLRVDEHVLDLLRAAGEPVAGPPPAYLKPWPLRGDAPRPPAHLAVERDRPLLEPKPVVLAHRLDAAAEVDALRGGRGVEQLGERGRQHAALVERAQDVLPRRRVEPLEERQQLVPDESALRVAVRRVAPEGEAPLAAVGLRLLAPHREQRPDDAVLAPRLDPGRGTARGEPVEDRLDLVGRAQAARGERVPKLAQLCLGPARWRDADDLGAELLRAQARVRVRLGTAQPVIDVQRRDAVAELAQRTPEAGRVGAAADEAQHLATGLDQLVPADVLLDAPDGVQVDSLAVTTSDRSSTCRGRLPPARARPCRSGRDARTPRGARAPRAACPPGRRARRRSAANGRRRGSAPPAVRGGTGKPERSARRSRRGSRRRPPARPTTATPPPRRGSRRVCRLRSGRRADRSARA